MILEAFAEYLHEADPNLSAPAVLARWLWERLTVPPESNVDSVLRAEIAMEVTRPEKRRKLRSYAEAPDTPNFVFTAVTPSGKRLLKSLYEYSMSYEQQKWSRWVHCVKASDFNHLSRQE